MDLVNWTHLHLSRILTSAQRRRDALHRARRDAPDVTRGSSVNMAAENGDHSPGVLQCLPKPRHYLRRFEVETVRPDHNLKRRMMAEHCDRLVPSASIISIKCLIRSRQKPPLLLPALRVSSAINLTG